LAQAVLASGFGGLRLFLTVNLKLIAALHANLAASK